MEEQRARQEDEARKAVAASASEAGVTVQKMEGTCVGLLLAMHFAPITKQPSNNPGARFTKYLTIYHTIIVSLS